MVKMLKLAPLAGIDNASERDDALQVGGESPSIFLRDANHVTLENGRASIRPGVRQVSSVRYQDVWQSTLHRDVFARLADAWVRIDTSDFTHATLATIGEAPVSHLVLNNLVLAAGLNGIFQYDGSGAVRYTLDAPPAPMVTLGPGSALPGKYGFAIAWLRGNLESSLSSIEHVSATASGTGFTVTPALPLDNTITKVRLYMTGRDGGELRRVGDYPANAPVTASPANLGALPPFRFMQPMPAGRFLSLWQGRIVTARVNVLNFSEALAYHVHDPRHGYVQMPQRITFVRPVDAGIWVGQVDHVAFLAGTAPDELVMHRKSVRAPVDGSAVYVDAQYLGDLADGGGQCVAWLAANGYVVGTANGAAVEPRGRRLTGIVGIGATVVHDGRLMTVTR